jgi:hypothetical protein
LFLKENYSNGHFNEREWEVKDFKELINDLSVSNFQLVADSISSLNDLIQYITFDKTTPGSNVTKEVSTSLFASYIFKKIKL